jgi:hypothetical protein
LANPTNTAGVVNRASPIRTIVTINGSAGAFVLLSASQGSFGYVEVQECPQGGVGNYTGGAFTGQGLEYQRADENYANTYPAVPGEIIQIGDAIAKNEHVGFGSFTYPDGVVRPATPYLKVKSASATAVYVEMREWRQLSR